ncbi:HlyD family efflux transporter periplasmic adaptor subunit [Hymenobacter aquaticus]|uniref:HlyD family efflux transporter periplasmic adaptor subunit n=1 Tax=Hymenobacter aquaticus TaxID=1867101 RepID=A0A4Z0Q1X3_9BACT|nr:HlyD family efflux transporter periplasmic adaptor subunit [Hymenobacter aquaticus]TGE23990.1 HlyD family efflux transporter periplasmic adaptor subunit [Hymenobacter aquaticus]
MPTDNPTYLIELRAEEVQEVLSRRPPWLLRWGGAFGLAATGLIFLCTWLIHYPDVVTAGFTLTSVNAPKVAVARTEGRIVKLLAHDTAPVLAGAPLAYLESTADHAEVLALARTLQAAWQLARQNQYADLQKLPLHGFHRLGELQNDYQSFLQKYTQIKFNTLTQYYRQQKDILDGQLLDLKKLETNLRHQEALQKAELDIARQQFQAQKQLAQQKVIPWLELEREKSKLLERQLLYTQVASGVILNTSAQRLKQKESLELAKALAEQLDNFQQAINTLQSATDTWMARYIVRAPTAGTLYLPRPLQENQQVSLNQELFYIAPANTRYTGEINIAQQNAGKVQPGQTVLIKFSGYPYQEYGLVKGRITSVAEVLLKNNVFLARVELPAHLVTTQGRTLKYKNGMTATAEIITTDNRLLYKILPPLKFLFDPAGV